ncbi:uncharacterized protein [Leptinotarsa decemlineata]|uniref:uncharacterized protein n=1 Tax=Leptinotarsa decemlineata TaxID=7539 RepID=UPI003D30CFC5
MLEYDLLFFRVFIRCVLFDSRRFAIISDGIIKTSYCFASRGVTDVRFFLWCFYMASLALVVWICYLFFHLRVVDGFWRFSYLRWFIINLWLSLVVVFNYWFPNPWDLATELRETTKALRQNGYGPKIIQKAIDRLRRTKKTSTRSTEDSPHDRQSVTTPYVKGVTDKIGRILRRKNIRTTYKPHKTISSWLPRPKERISLENQGVYSITCEDCGQQYIGQTNRRISARTQEHKNSIRTKQTSSALFQHHLQIGHKINFGSTKQIAQVQNPRIRQIREANEIEKQGLINKRDDSLNIPRIWKTIIKNNHQRQPQIDNEPSQLGELPKAINNPQVEKQVTNPYNLRKRSHIKTPQEEPNISYTSRSETVTRLDNAI